jgi:hypothetical protein
LRTLVDRPSWGYVLLPLAAPHHRREGLVYFWPSAGLASKALSRRRSRPTTTTMMTYKRLLTSVRGPWPLLRRPQLALELRITVSGVVLGLVAALAATITPALRVGSLALAAGILVALVLYGSMLLSPMPARTTRTERRHVLVRLLFNLAFFALSFGLLSVAMSIAVSSK